MDGQHLSWSALTTNCSGFGVYTGLSRHAEHSIFARGLTFKQMRVFADGMITVHDDRRAWILNYFAVRDPSVARVIPIDQPSAVPDFRPVQLMLRIGRPRIAFDSFAVSGLYAQIGSDQSEMAAFVLTIGLPAAREEEFFGKILAGHPHSTWETLYDSVLAVARRGG